MRPNPWKAWLAFALAFGATCFILKATIPMRCLSSLLSGCDAYAEVTMVGSSSTFSATVTIHNLSKHTIIIFGPVSTCTKCPANAAFPATLPAGATATFPFHASKEQADKSAPVVFLTDVPDQKRLVAFVD
jgi:hypothetical protein